MTDNHKGKARKLILGSTKLLFNKSIEQSNIITKSFCGSTSTRTIVEVRKSKVVSDNLSFNKMRTNDFDRDSESTGAEFNKRLAVLKKAAEDARAKDADHKINVSIKLALMNQAIAKESVAIDETDYEKPAIVEESPIIKQQQNEPLKPSVESPVVTAQNYFRAATEGLAEKDKFVDGKVLAPKAKIGESKTLKKADILNMLGADEGNSTMKTRSLTSIKKAREKAKRKLVQQKQEKIYREVIIPEIITIDDLANRMSERVADVIRELMKLGIIATINQSIDADIAELIVTTLGHTAKRVQESDVENILINEVDKIEDLKPRAPIVTIMGHVDHGKTSLLDALKSTNLASAEIGGITQHIGAYRVTLSDSKAITFIDTPGHEAFSAMRIRGGQVTDIVVIVVAADDGIKTQTIEAINHAKAANVPIIVALNKIDKADIDVDRVKNELLAHSLVSEEFGGDTMIIPISALKKINLDKLEEAILLVAEMQELKANPTGPASGVVIEAWVDKGKGVVATVLVQRGTLKNGDIVIAGTTYGKIKRINNDKGFGITKAEPTVPVEIYGLNLVPQAGDKFNVLQNEKQARDITEYRQRIEKEKKISVTKRSSLEDLFLKVSASGGEKELALIIKGDVQGSIEAIVTSLLKLPNDEVKLKILHHAVGGIIESDVTLAKASNAIIIGFNVKANNNALILANKTQVDIRHYAVIYNLLNDIKAIVSGMHTPIIREQYIGSVEIRQVFHVSKIGKVAGSYVTKGIIRICAGIRLLRNNIVIHEGKIKTLKRFKDDVKEVRENFECGIVFENYDNIEVGDIIEVFEVIEKKN